MLDDIGQEHWTADLGIYERQVSGIAFMKRATYQEATTASPGTSVERRRPGRTVIDPALVELLRIPTTETSLPIDDDWAPMEPATPSSGIALGLIVLVVAWIVAAAIGYALLAF